MLILPSRYSFFLGGWGGRQCYGVVLNNFSILSHLILAVLMLIIITVYKFCVLLFHLYKLVCFNIVLFINEMGETGWQSCKKDCWIGDRQSNCGMISKVSKRCFGKS